jgi:hypothetical protein
MENFYLIILILYSDELPIYKYNKLILKEYMNSNNDILPILIKYDNMIDEDIKYIKNENLLLVKGEEKYECKSIFNKTIQALKFCYSNYRFNYILRTNISTFWVYDNLLNFLKLDNKRNYIYGWKVNHLNNVGEKEYFISGTGIIIPYKLVPTLFNHNEIKCIMDDVEISQYFISNCIEIKDARKHNTNYLVKFEYDTKEKIDITLNNLNEKNVCFRIKSTLDREQNDKYILDNLLLKYYNKKINLIDNKLYNIGIKNTINFFASIKAVQYSGIVVDVIKKHLNKELIITNDYANADIIISHITDRRKLFDPKALNIITSGESRDINDIYDIYVGTRTITKAHISIYLPYLYLSLGEHNLSIEPKDYVNTKQLFCAYMYSHDVPHRVKYFNLLNNYKKVDGLGKSCNNIVEIENKVNIIENETYLDKAVKIYTNYKFVLALENFFQDGYFTEKIINPLIANSIPIYWGTHDVFKYINKKRVIYIQDYENDDELMKKIIELDNDDEKYNKIVSEPIFLENTYPEKIFKEFNYQMEKIFIL